MANTSFPRGAQREVNKGEAVRLRCAGYSFREIAERLGLPHHVAAWRLVHGALAEIRDSTSEAAAELRELTDQQLMQLLRAVWDRAISGEDDAAWDRALRVIDRRAKLHGLDMPQAQEQGATSYSLRICGEDWTVEATAPGGPTTTTTTETGDEDDTDAGND